MSWFDTAGIASLAKNALKEAQRTIDKALDIKDDDPAPSKVVAASTSAAEDESDGFFSSWGIKSPTSSLDVSTSKQGTPSAADLAVQHEPTPSTNNLWGSFTGSFFDADNKAEPEPGSTEDQPDTALVLRQPKKVTLEAVGTKQPPSSLGLARQNRGRNVAPFNPNRLSVISSSTGSPDEGGSESVEVLGSTSESSLSPETAEACQRLAEQSSPESVGIIAGGSSSDLTSPSSVEVLGWSEANSPCSPLRPLTLFPVRPQQQQPPLQSPVSDLLTPESVEFHPDCVFKNSELVINEEESEASLADDSSTSASSTTTTTVMEPRVAAIELTASAHMRTMLAEAMEEQASSHSSEHSSQTAGRDQHSPVSSLTSEPIKIECGQLSGQTSGDELETATSSDIEIISSPNGDSSSTHSRHSPTKLHPLVSVVRAELPSSGSPDSSTSERAPLRLPGIDPNAPSEEMLKKIHELHGLLEVRESKLFELSKNNIELQESNTDLQKQLEAGLQKQAANTQDVSQITEEFTQRLSALERRFQQAIRDKEALKRQLDSAKQEASGKVDVSELQAIVAEKDEEIKELRLEGEKLSKQQLQLSTLVKKLRAKEKEMETASKTNKQHLSELNQEAERLKKSLSAKEEVERSQIEAVNRLTAQVKRQDRELSAAQIQLNDMKEEKDRLQDSLDSINKEMTELRSLQLSSELAQRQVLSQQLEEKQVEINQLKITHERELEALRLEFTSSSASGSQREEQLRREHNAVLKKLQAAEARAEELAHCTSDSTKPLLRQLEALQASASSQQQLAERSERQLCDKISELQAKLTAISEQERLSRDRNSTINAQLVALQTEIATLTATHKELQVACTTYQHEKQTLSQSIKGIQEQHKEEVEGLRKEISLMKDQLAVQQAATEAEKRHVAALEFKLKQAEVARSQMLEQNPLTVSISHQAASQSPPRASPAPSLSDSVASTSWLPDDVLEGVGVLSLANEIASGGATSALLEGLQSQVKRRDGETALLRSQTKRLEAQRTELASQVATLLSKAETQAAELQRLSELERKYDALLQMYGEQLEANQELRMDLDDVKEMYRTQIEALLGTNGSQPPL